MGEVAAHGVGGRPHPRNRDFVWRDASPAGARRLTPAQIEAFNRDGFFKLEAAFTPEELAAVEAAIDPMEDAVDRRMRASSREAARDAADAHTFTIHIAQRSPVLRAFAKHRVYQDIAHDLIGPDARLYWDQSVYKKSGKRQEFPWHQDNGYTFIEPQQYLTCWTPLVDVDEENGCPWIAPGLHRGGTLAHRQTSIGLKCFDEAPDAICVPAKAGDVIVFSSLAPHRTGPNLRAGTVRKAYILQYAPHGAVAYRDGKTPEPQDDPARQFRIMD